MTRRLPVRTANTSTFCFYDIESLANVFTLCMYSTNLENKSFLNVFYLLDDAGDGSVRNPRNDTEKTHMIRMIRDAISTSNPALPPWCLVPTPGYTCLNVLDLREALSNSTLATLMGVSTSADVCDPHSEDIYAHRYRPVCDTDANYDPASHPFLAGYNSFNYDTTMLAWYFNEVYSFPAVETTPHRQSPPIIEPKFQPTTARTMRAHSDELFSPDHINHMPDTLPRNGAVRSIRRAMLNSGRHLDVARLNEHQQRVSLKRLLGMMGYQIKESSKLSHDTTVTTKEEFYELIAYNVSDCLGLSQLFRDPVYSGGFDLKAGLLSQYSDTVFDSNGSVRRDRLTIDASSARFVSRILAPGKPLKDLQSVSLVYPHPVIAAEMRREGKKIKSVNILDECVTFFKENIAPDDQEISQAQREARDQFMEIVKYYRSIEGKNFNDSDRYVHDFGDNGLPCQVLKDIPKTANNIPYFDKDGNPTSCFATFSTGGIHGAEYHSDLYNYHKEQYDAAVDQLRKVQELYPDPRQFRDEALRQHNELTLPDGSRVDKRRVLLGSDPTTVRYRKPKSDDPEQRQQLHQAMAFYPNPADLLATQRPASEELVVVHGDDVFDGKDLLDNTTQSNPTYRTTVKVKKPEIFVTNDDGSTKLHPQYAYTSVGVVVHEDFTSYYPNLLRNMRAFYNPELGEDRYAQIFEDKQRYSREMKQKDITPEERARLSILRNGTKLILNSASGAGDAAFDNAIRMNNQIISMRIIGQLLIWRIAQGQTLGHARIGSTNTDGIYSLLRETPEEGSSDTSLFTEDKNNKLLTTLASSTNIEIEPERMFLVSKDSNNRLELAAPAPGQPAIPGAILGASGGTLACYQGPTPTKSLAHPAALDYGLARYLQQVAARGQQALSLPFDRDLGRRILDEIVASNDPTTILTFFQMMVTASRATISYPFEVQFDPSCSQLRHDSEGCVTSIVDYRPLSMVNRVFIVKPGTPRAWHLVTAGAWKVPPASRDKRGATESGFVSHCDPIAVKILRSHGWVKTRYELWAHEDAGVRLLPEDQDITIRRFARLDPTWPVTIVNDDLHSLSSERQQKLINSLDIDIYTSMLDDVFTKNWRNTPVITERTPHDDTVIDTVSSTD